MRPCYILMTACGFACLLAGCTTPPPPAAPGPSAEELEKARAEELSRLDGLWLLKSSLVQAEHGTYSLNSGDGSDLIYRIRNGVMELQNGDEWVKYAKLSIGAEPQSLLCAKTDAVGQQRIMPFLYKLEGETLLTVQDNLYPEHLPESFSLQEGLDRQRQANTYVKIKDAPRKPVVKQ